ncbi:hypothetical protein CFO_g3726 [Ceratocystis platani]|uniref:Uncharacterized protein n=1 Tax=Ceratocystis fimbriata f. sp. platani TaxID=88771 RepID=A0A0F8BN19_CERFI|nr:hypothetical protein CFO_g3726 [Ceratocystis platani]
MSTEPTAISDPKPTNPDDPYYLSKRGYGAWHLDGGGIKVYSERYGNPAASNPVSGPYVNPTASKPVPEQYANPAASKPVPEQYVNPAAFKSVFHAYLDKDHKAVTIYSNNLDQESASENNLAPFQIFRALCFQKSIHYKTMELVNMDVNDPTTRKFIRNYRKSNRLGSDRKIEVTPSHEDWKMFTSIFYYDHAVQMISWLEIDKITIEQQKREIQTPGHPSAAVEVMMFSFKQSVPEDKNIAIDPIDQHAAELAAEDNLKASIKSAEDVSGADFKTVLDAIAADSGLSPDDSEMTNLKESGSEDDFEFPSESAMPSS